MDVRGVHLDGLPDERNGFGLPWRAGTGGAPFVAYRPKPPVSLADDLERNRLPAQLVTAPGPRYVGIDRWRMQVRFRNKDRAIGEQRHHLTRLPTQDQGIFLVSGDKLQALLFGIPAEPLWIERCLQIGRASCGESRYRYV